MADNETIFGDPWKPFGLRGDPFFQEELEAGPNAVRPARRLFVGREDELRRVGRRIGGAKLSRTIVQGEAGVGKTSFVNRLKSELAETGEYAAPEQPIRMTTRTTPESFLADVLRVLVRVHNESGARRGEFWERIAHLVESQTSTSGGIQVAGSGVQIDQTHVPATVSSEPLIDAIREGLERLNMELGVEIFLHINNLENMTLEEESRARLVIQDVRDVFLQRGAHWLFVGSGDLDQEVFRQADQVGGIFQAPILIDSLSKSDVEQLLSLRYDHLRDSTRQLVCPVEPAEAAALYDRYHGDLRNFLRLLSDASERVLGLEGVTPMTRHQILRAAGGEYRARMLENVGKEDVKYLSKIDNAAEDRPFRVTEITEWLDVPQGTASRIANRLQDAGLIQEIRREGRSIYYRPTGIASVGLAAQ